MKIKSFLSRFKSLPSKFRLAVIFTCLSIFSMWAWLPFVEVSSLSASPLLGRSISVIVYFFIAGSSSLIFTISLRYLWRIYKSWERPAWQFLIVFFVVWAATEWLASWLVTVVWFGEGASFDSVLPFSSLTPFLMYTPLSLLSRFIGFHGLSALVVTIGLCLVSGRLRRHSIPLIVAVALLTGLSWLCYHQADGVNIKAVIAAEELDRRLPVIKTDADLVVLPEYGFDDITKANIKDRLTGNKNNEVFFIGSKLASKGAGLENRLVFGSSKQGYIGEIAKSRLIPGGEYLPFLAKAPLKVLGADDVLQKFEATREIMQGDLPTKPFVMTEGLVIGGEACASIITPNDYRELTGQGATILTNSASLEIFRSPIFDVQHQGLARFMAVANARPMLQSANTGSGFALDHNGKLMALINPVNMKEVGITSNSKTTPYQLLGEWPVYLGGLLILLLTGKAMLRRRKSSK